MRQKMNPTEYESAFSLSVVRTKTGAIFEKLYESVVQAFNQRSQQKLAWSAYCGKPSEFCLRAFLSTNYGAIWQSSFEYAEDCVELNAFTR